MKLHLRKNLQILALAFSISIGAHAATQADIANLTRSANAGNAIDQYNLGLAYGRGEGVAVNFSEAFKWFKMAADNGNSLAMYFVGGYYLAGRGVDRNLLASEEWMLKAANQGAKPAQQALVSFYRDGAGEPAVPRNAAKAKYWQDVIDGKITLSVDKPPINSAVGKKANIAKELDTNCHTNPNTGLPIGFKNMQYEDAICALSAFQRPETIPVTTCLRDLNQLKGKPNSLSMAESLIKQCDDEWIKLYHALFDSYEEKYANCVEPKRKNREAPLTPEFYKRLSIERRIFGYNYEMYHKPNGEEIIPGDERMQISIDCFPPDADYTLLKRFIYFSWESRLDYKDSSIQYFHVFADNIKESILQADKLAKSQAEEQFRVKAMERERERERYAINWRKGIKEGDYTNMGMVIEVRGNVIKVQQRLCNLFGGNCETDIQYVRRDELYPSGN